MRQAEPVETPTPHRSTDAESQGPLPSETAPDGPPAIIGPDGPVTIASPTSIQKTPKAAAFYNENEVGRLFVWWGENLYTCSGSILLSNNESLGLTAGHCLYNQGRGGFADAAAFVPGYEDGATPFGIYAVISGFVTDGWVLDQDADYDYAMFVVDRQGDGTSLLDAVGEAMYLGYNFPHPDLYRFVSGYPAAPPYDGDREYWCDGMSVLDPRDFTVPVAWGLGDCDLTGGASGGPFYYWEDAVANYVADGVVSYGYGDLPDYLFTPYFDSDVTDMFLAADAVVPQLFVDVPPSHPAYVEITWMGTEGISQGYSDGTYRPTLPTLRGHMAIFLYRLAGEPAFTPPAVSPFTDVPTSHPAYLPITWLADQGISQGYPDGTYRPTVATLRGHMAVFLYRMAGEPAFTPPPVSPFSDVLTSHPAYLPITWLAEEEISKGYSDGTFRPQIDTLRGHMAVFMYRFDHNLP